MSEAEKLRDVIRHALLEAAGNIDCGFIITAVDEFCARMGAAGYAIVPKVATPDMNSAAYMWHVGHAVDPAWSPKKRYDEAYTVMLSAAPKVLP